MARSLERRREGDPCCKTRGHRDGNKRNLSFRPGRCTAEGNREDGAGFAARETTERQSMGPERKRSGTENDTRKISVNSHSEREEVIITQ